jgi:phytoene/squalene synthetase
LKGNLLIVSTPTLTKTKSGLALYTQAAEASSAVVIGNYSTSFGWATKLLGKDDRHHVRNIYALVRVADEIVDGAAAEALTGAIGIDPHVMLDKLEQETYRAVECGFSTNLVVHAFAYTAREVGIKREIIQPFFNSMRTDLFQRVHDKRSIEAYIYGSAEVVGLMCLQVFLSRTPVRDEEKAEFVTGARALGAAFQKVNFLRDLSADFDKLGRSYFPLIRVEDFSNSERDQLVQDIRDDINSSKISLAKLPESSKRAVGAALMFFEALNNKIAATPAKELIKKRIRVSNPQKIFILLKATFGVSPK